MGKTFSTGLLTNGIWQDASNNIGIGGSPSGSYKLEVTGTGRFTNFLKVSGNNALGASSIGGMEMAYFGAEAKSRIIIGDGTGYSLSFSKRTGSANTDLFTILDTGNVGIGVTPSNGWVDGKALEVGFVGSAIWGRYVNEFHLTNNYYYSASTNSRLYASTAPASDYEQYNGIHTWYTAPSGTINTAVTLTSRMTITNAGNVGIGTSSPAYTLDVSGNVAATRFWVASGGNETDPMIRVKDDTDTGIFFPAANIMAFSTGATERMRIISSGNISIATTTDFGYKLNLNGQPGCNGYTAWTNWSDSRLKENVTDLETTNVLDKICAIRPVTYNYNELSGFDEETRARRISGFIAQELMEVFPDMVGTIKKGDDEYYDTNLSNLTLYLVKAVQELSAQNQDLKSRLDKAGL